MEKRHYQHGLAKFNPIVTAILLTLPAISQAADLSIKNASTGMANGVPVVNITGANANGISHNIYDKLNVGKEGIIFNNSKDGATSQLAGQIAGNNNLANGTAKVILNEVTSKNKSALNGMMEVAGDKAHLIIANPNGITCESCGFINTDKVTMTTGKPDMQNGELKGYSVSSGSITTNGLTNDSPTNILARSVVIEGDINSRSDVTVIAGNNAINADGQVTGTVKTAFLSTPTYGIDVAKLGGMYANKINLISTESGVGVRNRGKIMAGDGGIQIDSKGRLLNNNATLQATGNIAIKTNNALENETGTLASEKAISIDTNKNTISNINSGKITSGSDITISSGKFNNSQGKVAATNSVAIDTNGNSLNNTGKSTDAGISAGAVFLKTGELNNSGGQITGYYVGTTSTTFDNSKGKIDSWGDVDISTSKALDNSTGLIRSADGHVKIDTAGNTLNNNNTRTADTISKDTLGIVAGAGGIQITSGAIKNEGQIVSSGNIDIDSTGNVKSVSGKVLSGKNISIKAASITNDKGSMVAEDDVNFNVSGEVQNNIGALNAKNGTMNIKAKTVNNYSGLLLGHDIKIETTGEVDNSAALMVATNDITINTTGTVLNQYSNLFKNMYAQYFGMSSQEGGMIAKGSADIKANRIYTNSSRLIAENGSLNIDATKSLSNDFGLISAAKGIMVNTDSMVNNFATIHTAGDITINTGWLDQLASGSADKNTAAGIISSGNNLTLNVGNDFSNFGWITGANSTSVTATGTLYNHNTIYSQNSTTVYGKAGVHNHGTLVGDRSLTVGTTGTVYNTSDLFSEGTARISGKTLYTTLTGVTGAKQGLELDVKTQMGLGKTVGL